MNGMYTIGNPDTTSKTKFSTDYTRRGDSVEFFDVYSPPIQTRYGEVYWTMMDPVAVPSERYKINSRIQPSLLLVMKWTKSNRQRMALKLAYQFTTRTTTTTARGW